MKPLRNWDDKTWLSSRKYISSFHKYLKSKVNFNRDTKILDIGCGRANIISYLQKRYKFYKKPIGLDVVENKKIKKNIIFIKKDAIKHFKKALSIDKHYDLSSISKDIAQELLKSIKEKSKTQ